MKAACGWTSFVSDFCQSWLEKFFYKLGLVAFKRPLLFLICGVFLTVLCGLGFMNFIMETRVNYLVSFIIISFIYSFNIQKI